MPRAATLARAGSASLGCLPFCRRGRDVPPGRPRGKNVGGGRGRVGNAMSRVILDVRNLTKAFPIGAGLIEQLLQFGKASAVRAVDNVSFEVAEGEVLGIIGES